MNRRSNFIAAAIVILIVTTRYVGMCSATGPDFNVTTVKQADDKTGSSHNSTLRNGSAATKSSKLGECLQRTVFLLQNCVTTKNLFLTFVALTLGIWSVVANSLPLAEIIRQEQLHKPVYILMANLAASDVFTGIAFVISGSSTLYVIQTEIIPSNVVLRIRFTLVLLSRLSSAYGLMVLTAERYWFIVHGMTYVNNVTNDKCKVVVAIIWVWSLLLATLSNISQCVDRFDETGVPFGAGLSTKYAIVVVVFIFIPMTAIFLFNMGVLWCLWKHINAIADQEAAVGAPPSTSRKAAITIVIITAVFLVGWLPFFVRMAVLTTDMESLHKTMIFVILNSAINPVIYAFRLRDVRQGVARLFVRYRGKNSNLVINLNKTVNYVSSVTSLLCRTRI